MRLSNAFRIDFGEWDIPESVARAAIQETFRHAHIPQNPAAQIENAMHIGIMAGSAKTERGFIQAFIKRFSITSVQASASDLRNHKELLFRCLYLFFPGSSDFESFCFDHLRDVYDTFASGTGMTRKDQMELLLPLNAGEVLEALAHSRAVTLPKMRRLLEEAMPEVSEFDAFCRTKFPEVYDRFATGMDRVRKTTILLEQVTPTINFLKALFGLPI